MAEKRDDRVRAWSFIGYPGDSLSDDYASILSDEMHLAWCESPVHDADLNGDGSEKKTHIHFLVIFEGPKSFEQMKEITDRLHCPVPQKCRNPRGLVRYFIHLDNPEKAQYKVEDIKCHGGISIDEYFRKSITELDDIIYEMIDFCEDNDIDDFYKLVGYARQMRNRDWLTILIHKNTTFFTAFLKSKHFRKLEEQKETIAVLRTMSDAYKPKSTQDTLNR